MKSTDPVLSHVLARLAADFEKTGRLLEATPVQHGLRLGFEENGRRAAGILYHSLKKHRLTWVPQPGSDERLAKLLSSAVAKRTGAGADSAPGGAGSPGEKGAALPRTTLPEAERKLARWIGTDEAGKGDLFGPLVVAGFLAEQSVRRELERLGVRDSKELSPGRIRELAEMLNRRWPKRCKVVPIGPERYNKWYAELAKEGKVGGINILLGWGHATAIKDLLEREERVEAVVVDRFGGEGRLKRYLPAGFAPRLLLRPKAEDNIAVAAAALLARDAFDRALDRMGNELGFRPHAGSGAPAQRDLKRLKAERPEDLARFVKLHFAPVRKML